MNEWLQKSKDLLKACFENVNITYNIPLNDTYFELSVFWLSNTENRINELRFSDSVSLSFKTRLT